MSDLPDGLAVPRQKLWINAGAGHRRDNPRSRLFDDWREVRVDINRSVAPDIVADITDLSEIPDNVADALWSSHCLEHLFQHQVAGALAEFRRVIADDGFIVCLVPDIQAVAGLIAADKSHEPLYQSPAGPVTPHDMFYGHGPSIAQGDTNMAHRCGFTPTVVVNLMNQVGFAEFLIRRLASLELVVVARKTPGDEGSSCESLIQALNL
jgi:SAM-dependent methyltransferase